MTLANKLTLARAFLGVLVFMCLRTLRPGLYAVALLLYAAATVTDWVDGWIARRTRSVSPFGAMADPVADKVLVIGALIAFLKIDGLDIPHWSVFLVIVRELVIGGLRALAGAMGKLLSAERHGKWKMGVQSACVLIILAQIVLRDTLGVRLPSAAQGLPYALAWLCVLVTWGSAVIYLWQNRLLLQHSWNAKAP